MTATIPCSRPRKRGAPGSCPPRRSAKRVTSAAVAIALALSGVLTSCGSGGDTAPGTFTVDFPTDAAAIATSTVQVFAYATTVFGPGAAAAAGACETVIEARRSNNLTATPVATSAVVKPCQLLTGAGKVAVRFGNYAFLAVGQQNGSDFLLGCAEQTISSANTVVVIPLSLATEGAMVPATKCTSLGESCSGGC